MQTKVLTIILLLYVLIGFPDAIRVSIAQNTIPVRTPTVFPAESEDPDLPFAISVESVVKQLRATQKKIILVDVRSKSEFENFRIPGSINIPLFAIKTKTFLKSKSLVLVNEGYHPNQLQQACKVLEKAGFHVRFLYGGFNAWKEQGYALDGDVFAQSELNRMPAQSLFTEKENEHWIVIDISAPENPQTSALLPQSISIPYTTTHEEQFILALEETLTSHDNNPCISIVIVDEFGEHYGHIEKAVQNTDINNVFFLKGGLEAYKKFIDQQMLISQAKGKPKTLEACPCCP